MKKIALALTAAAALVATRAHADPSVWAIDDGEKIRRDATHTPFERGEENPVWHPGAPIRLFAMRNESVAVQIVVEADDTPLQGVLVDLYTLDGPDGAKLVGEGSPSTAGHPIEVFVEHFSPVKSASHGRTDAESVGWEPGSGPPGDAWVGPVPDALIPILSAPPWATYPMNIEPRTNGIVWIDLNVARDQPAGTYRGVVLVHTPDRSLAKLPMELEIVDATLPDRTVDVAAAYDAETVEHRSGARAEETMWQLLRAHRISPVHDLEVQRDVARQMDAITGSLYTRAHRYFGPGPGMGDTMLSMGAHGTLRAGDEADVAMVQTLADSVSDAHGFAGRGVFLWAADEKCSSSAGGEWLEKLHASKDPEARRVRVAWTCSQDPTLQPVDVPILQAAWDPGRVRAAREQGKEVWVYGGVLPRTGTFLLDADAVSPRVNGWLQAMYDIPRWIMPDVARWGRDGGQTPIDPFEDPETGDPSYGSVANGGDMLVYPGKQMDDLQEHSLGIDGVVASIRLKNWRRGIEDAGYLQMAREHDRAKADAVARWLIPAAFGEAPSGEPAAWSERGRPFFQARQALLAIALGHAPADLGPAPVRVSAASTPAGGAGCAQGVGETGGGAVLALVVVAVITGRTRRSRRSQRADARALP